jgi:hypothetical protein
LASATTTAEPPTALPKIVPVLDETKGQRALADYRTFLGQLCSSPGARGANRAAELTRGGLHGNGDFICARTDTAGKAIASGAIGQADVDEVLVESASGLDWAAGDRALALMRSNGKRYELVEHLLHGKGWMPVARIATPSRRDILMLCEEGGHMGLYPGTCGFLGEGSFRRASSRGGREPSTQNEIETVFVTTCGPGGSVSLGEIKVHDARLQVELLVENFVLERNAKDEGDFCSKRITKTREQLTMEYRFDGARFQRVTPVPQQARSVLQRY